MDYMRFFRQLPRSVGHESTESDRKGRGAWIYACELADKCNCRLAGSRSAAGLWLPTGSGWCFQRSRIIIHRQCRMTTSAFLTAVIRPQGAEYHVWFNNCSVMNFVHAPRPHQQPERIYRRKPSLPEHLLNHIYITHCRGVLFCNR